MNIQGDTELFNFLTSAPKEFKENERIRKYQLKNGDFIHCVLWNNHFYITGTDVVKILVWRFQNAKRNIVSLKKFEEGVFSDLRNLKPGIDATLENPRSEFLEFLYKNGCIRTQKKQKVFFWYSVPHDALFCDALERDLRRENSVQFKMIEEEDIERRKRQIKFQQTDKVRSLLFNEPGPNMGLHSHPGIGNMGMHSTNNNMNGYYNYNTMNGYMGNAGANGHVYNSNNAPINNGFVAPFSLSDLDARSALFNEETFEDVFESSKKYEKQRDGGNEMIGENNETFSMPNIQSGFQK